jgi:hypothetical protein
MTFPFPVFCPVVDGVVTSLSYVDVMEFTSPSFSIPEAAQAGDLCIVIYAALNSSSAPTPVTPDGFEELAEGRSTNRLALWLYGKVLESGDLSETFTGASGSTGVRGKVVIFRGDVPINSITAGAPNGEATSGNPSAQTILSSGGATPMVVIGAAHGQGSGGAPSPSGTLASAGTELDTGSTTQRAVYLIINNGAPADYTWDVQDTGDYNALVSNYISVS